MTFEEYFEGYPGVCFWNAELWDEDARPADWKTVVRRVNGLLLEIQAAGYRNGYKLETVRNRMNDASVWIWNVFAEVGNIDFVIDEFLDMAVRKGGMVEYD